jgi:L-ascorbate 6-phosphate lactonase
MIPVPFDPTDVQAADAVLATHEHVDHVQEPILSATDASLFGPSEAVSVARTEEEWVRNCDIKSHQLETVEEEDVLEIGSFTIHIMLAHDPDAK